MDINAALERLRQRGHKIGDPALYDNVGPLGGRMHVVVDDVVMTYRQAVALAEGRTTLEMITRTNTSVTTR